VLVRELEPGMVVVGEGDELVAVVAVEQSDRVEPTFNLTVNGFQTCFVFDAEGRVGMWGAQLQCRASGLRI